MKLAPKPNEDGVVTISRKRKHEISNENTKRENFLGLSPKKKRKKNLNITAAEIEPRIKSDLTNESEKKKRKNQHSEYENVNRSESANKSAVNTTNGYDINTPELDPHKIEIKTETSSVGKKKKRKRKGDMIINPEKVTTPNISQIDPNNDHVASTTDASDDTTTKVKHDKNSSTDIRNENNSLLLSSESNSPKKKKRKKSKANLISYDQNQLDKSLESDPTQNEKKVVSKPLKSSLKKKKKKKNKNKNKLNSTKSPGDTNECSSNTKKLTWKKSVTFDDNVQVELIDSCLAKSPEEKTQVNNERKKEKALAYLQRWKHDKSNWKFEKLTQMWLLKQMYHENMVSSDVFPDLLEYLVNLKGASKELVIKLSQQIIAKMTKKVPEENDEELETAYRRARSVLQHLQ